MIDSLTKVWDLERELNAKLDLTEREKRMLEAIQYLLGFGWQPIHPMPVTADRQ